MKLISQWQMFIQSVLTLGHRCHQGTRREQDKEHLPFSRSFVYGPLVPISRSLRRSRASCSSLSLISLKLFLIPCSGHSRARGEVVCFLSLTSLYFLLFRRELAIDVDDCKFSHPSWEDPVEVEPGPSFPIALRDAFALGRGVRGRGAVWIAPGL